MSSSEQRRYLHLAGGFGAGGWFTNVGPKKDANIPIPSIAAVHLPMVGGSSEAKASRTEVAVGRPGSKDRQLLMTVGSAYSLADTTPPDVTKPAKSRTISEVKAVKVDDFSLKFCRLELRTYHPPTEVQPQITFGPTEITGLKLGGKELTVTLDTAPFNKYSTLAGLEEAYLAGKLPKWLVRTFRIDEKTGKWYRNASGHVYASIVKKIEGTLPEGATIEPNGYVIHWPKFGRIILGEVIMGPHIRRGILVRLEHSDDEVGSGCSGGSYYP